MKKISKFLYSLAVLSFAAVSCDITKEQAEPYNPGEPEEEGCYGVYFPTQEISSLAFEPSTTDYPIEIDVARTSEKGSITVPVVIEGSGAEYLTLDPVTFEDGQKEATVKGTISCKMEEGTSYSATISVKDAKYASKYSTNPTYISLDFVIEKWTLLGQAEFWDLWIGGDLSEDGYKVDLYQNSGNTDLYRLVEPYKQLWEDYGPSYIAGGWELSDPDSKIEFQVMRAGQKIHEGIEGFEMEITSDGAIYYSPIKMGLYHPYYGADVYSYNPADLGSTAGDEANLAWNKVANWQDSGLPSVAYLAGSRYMPGLGGWGGDDSPDEAIVVRFPGGVFVDYTFSVEIGTSEEGVAPIQFFVGPDVTKVLYAVYEGELTSKEIRTKKASIAAGEETAAKTLDLETGAVNFSAEATGIYTLVAVAFDKDDAEQNNVSASFGYVKKGDDEKVEIVAGATLELPAEAYQALGYDVTKNLMFTLYGKDIKVASVAYVTAEDYEADADSCWTLVSPVKDEILASINQVGGYTGILTSLMPKTEYVLLAEFNNGYKEARYVASCSTEGLEPEKKATGTYTLNAFFEGDIPGVELYFDPNTEQSYFLKDYVGYGTNFNFEWVAATDSLIIPTPQIMTSSSNYGAIYFGEVLDFCNYLYGENASAAIAYYEAQGMEITGIAGTSKYVRDSTTFKFALFYYSTAGYIGSGVETYQIDPVSRTLKKKSSTGIHWVKAITPSVKLKSDNIVWKLPFVERTVKAAKYTVTPAQRKPRAEILMSKPIIKAE